MLRLWGDFMFGLEKIPRLEKLVQELNEKVNELDTEVNILRNEVKEFRRSK